MVWKDVYYSCIIKQGSLAWLVVPFMCYCDSVFRSDLYANDRSTKSVLVSEMADFRGGVFVYQVACNLVYCGDTCNGKWKYRSSGFCSVDLKEEYIHGNVDEFQVHVPVVLDDYQVCTASFYQR